MAEDNLLKFSKFVKQKNCEQIYLITAKEKGRSAWYYLKVDPTKLVLFKKEAEKGITGLNKYGKILYSGWGIEPPADIMKKIEAEYAA